MLLSLCHNLTQVIQKSVMQIRTAQVTQTLRLQKPAHVLLLNRQGRQGDNYLCPFHRRTVRTNEFAGNRICNLSRRCRSRKFIYNIILLIKQRCSILLLVSHYIPFSNLTTLSCNELPSLFVWPCIAIVLRAFSCSK